MEKLTEPARTSELVERDCFDRKRKHYLNSLEYFVNTLKLIDHFLSVVKSKHFAKIFCQCRSADR